MKDQRGVLLLLALVITSIIVAAGLVLGTVIIRDVRLSTISDKGVIALYASETAAEDAIYHMFKLGEDASTLPTSGSLASGGSWTRESKTTDRRFVFDTLPRAATGEINIYNTANLNQAAGVESFSISWTSGSTMTVDIFEWDGTNLTSVGSSQYVCTGLPCDSIVVNTPVSSRAYQVLVTADNQTITDLIVSMFQNDGGAGDPVQVEIPVTVVATGEYQGARQAVQLRVPEPAPWGGVALPPAAVCGNGVVESGETCDDNNTTSGDGCSSACIIESPSATCGNGVVEAGESCDDGNATNVGTCNALCTALTYCSDGTVQNPDGAGVAEQCDDGNVNNNDGCDAACVLECGNGVLEPAEQCDPAMGGNPYGCTNACVVFGSGGGGVHRLSNGRILVAHGSGGLTLSEFSMGGGSFASPYYPSAGTVGFAECATGTVVIDGSDNVSCVRSTGSGMAIGQYPRSGAEGTLLNITGGTLHGSPLDMERASDGYWIIAYASLAKINFSGSMVAQIGNKPFGFCCDTGSADGQFTYATGVGISPSGEVFVADGGNNRIQVFSSGGSFVRKFNVFFNPMDVAVDGSHAYVLMSSGVQKYTHTGTLVTQWSVQTTISSEISLNAATGTIFVSEVDASKNYATVIREYSNTGALLNTAP